MKAGGEPSGLPSEHREPITAATDKVSLAVDCGVGTRRRMGLQPLGPVKPRNERSESHCSLPTVAALEIDTVPTT